MDYDDAQNPLSDWINRVQTDSSAQCIYTHDDNSYSLIRIDGETIYSAGITFSEVGTDLHAIYQSAYPSPSQRSATIGDVSDQLSFESFVLSQALYISSFIEIGSFDELIGVPYYYGWNFNWRGDKATICTRTSDTTGNAVQGYTHRRYNLVITEDADGVLTAVVTLEETEHSEPKGTEFVLWFPNSQASMSPEGPNTCGFLYYPDGYGEISYNVPLYSFYGADNQEVVVRLFKDLGSGDDYDTNKYNAYQEACPDNFQRNTRGTSEVTGGGQCRSDEIGVEVGGTRYSFIYNNGGGFSIHRRIILGSSDFPGPLYKSGGWSSAELSVWTKTDFIIYAESGGCMQQLCKFETSCMGIDYLSEVHSTGDPAVGDKSGKIAIIIPYRSTESVIIATVQRTRQASQTETRTGTTYEKVRQLIRYTTDPVPEAPDFVGFWCPMGGCGESDIIRTQNEVSGGDGCNTRHTQEFESSSSDKYVIKRFVITPFEAVQTEELHREVDDGLGSYDPVFGPAMCTGLATMNYTVNIGSAFGHSIRSESESSPYTGSNCNIPAEKANPDGFWVGWA